MTKNETAIVVAIVGASATLCVAIFGALTAYLAGKRERRRILYSESVKAAVAWKELLYRVRRRQAGQEADLVARFHDRQDDLSYYQAWIGSESSYMKRSYDALVRGVKTKTESLITAAWAEPVRDLPGNALPDDAHPDLEDLTEAFLRDVRSHLSPWPWRKLAARWRNRKSVSTTASR